MAIHPMEKTVDISEAVTEAVRTVFSMPVKVGESDLGGGESGFGMARKAMLALVKIVRCLDSGWHSLHSTHVQSTVDIRLNLSQSSTVRSISS